MILKAENILHKAALLLAGAAALMSCSKLIYEGEGECEDVVEIYVKYDYNIQRADMRPDHVGWAQVYALDQNGKVAAAVTVSPKEAKDKNSTVTFTGLQPGRYTFMAMAMQAPYGTLAAQPEGARFHANLPQVGTSASELEIKLDRAAVPGASHFVVNAPANGLDTLWVGHSIAPQGIIVPDTKDQRGNVIKDTISLVRDTKYLHLTLHQLEDKRRADIHDTDFEVRVVDANGRIGWNNSLLEDDLLFYAPHASWTSALSKNGVPYDSEEEAKKAPESDPIVERAAHFDISFSRLMFYASLAEGINAELVIVNKADNKEVVRLNLPYYLSFGRDAYSIRNYSRQEYLDREYDYHLDFFLQNGYWKELYVRINVMSWQKRFQNNIL